MDMDLIPDPREALSRYKLPNAGSISQSGRSEIPHQALVNPSSVDTEKIENVREEGERLLSRVINLRKRVENANHGLGLDSAAQRSNFTSMQAPKSRQKRSSKSHGEKGGMSSKDVRNRGQNSIGPSRNFNGRLQKAKQRSTGQENTSTSANVQSRRAGATKKMQRKHRHREASGPLSAGFPTNKGSGVKDASASIPGLGSSRNNADKLGEKVAGSLLDGGEMRQTEKIPELSRAAPDTPRKWGEVEELLQESHNIEELRETLNSMKGDTQEVFEALPKLTKALTEMKADTANAADDLQGRMKALVKDYRVMQGILAKAPLGFSGLTDEFSCEPANRPAWMPPREEFDYEMLGAEMDDIAAREKEIYQKINRLHRTGLSDENTNPSGLSHFISQRINSYHRDMRKHARQALRYQRQQQALREQEKSAGKAASSSRYFREPPLQHLAPWMEPSQAWRDQQKRAQRPKPLVVPKPETPWYLETSDDEITALARPKPSKSSEYTKKSKLTVQKTGSRRENHVNETKGVFKENRPSQTKLPGQHTAARQRSRKENKRSALDQDTPYNADKDDRARSIAASERSKPAARVVAKATSSSATQCEDLPKETLNVVEMVRLLNGGHPRVCALDVLPSFCTDCLLASSEPGHMGNIARGCLAVYSVFYLHCSQRVLATIAEELPQMSDEAQPLEGIKTGLLAFQQLKTEELIAALCLALSALQLSSSTSIIDRATKTYSQQLAELCATKPVHASLLQHGSCDVKLLHQGLEASMKAARQVYTCPKTTPVREAVRVTASTFLSVTGKLLSPFAVAAVQVVARDHRWSELEIATAVEELDVVEEDVTCVRAVLRCTETYQCDSQWKSGLEELLMQLVDGDTAFCTSNKAEVQSEFAGEVEDFQYVIEKTLQHAAGLRKCKRPQVDLLLELSSVAESQLAVAKERPQIASKPSTPLRICALNRNSPKTSQDLAQDAAISSPIQKQNTDSAVSAEVLERYVRGSVVATTALTQPSIEDTRELPRPVSSLGLAPAGAIQQFINQGEAVDVPKLSGIAVSLVQEDLKAAEAKSSSVRIVEGPSDAAILEMVTSLLLDSQEGDSALDAIVQQPRADTREEQVPTVPVECGVQAEAPDTTSSIATLQLQSLEKQVGLLTAELSKSYDQKLEKEVALVRKEAQVATKAHHLEELEQHIEQREVLQRKWEESMMERMEQLREESSQLQLHTAPLPANDPSQIPKNVVHEQGIQADYNASTTCVETQCELPEDATLTSSQNQTKNPDSPPESDPKEAELQDVLTTLRQAIEENRQHQLQLLQQEKERSAAQISTIEHAKEMAMAVRTETQHAIGELRELSAAQHEVVMKHLEEKKEVEKPEVERIQANERAEDRLPNRPRTLLNWEDSEEDSEGDDNDTSADTSELSEGQIDADLGALSDGEQVLAPSFEPNITVLHMGIATD